MNHTIITLWVMLNCIALTDAQTVVYEKAINNLRLQKLRINKNAESSLKVKLCSDLLYTSLTDTVFPSWYGTPWDFNGTSNVPGQGKIACGYFVSTTLKHVGFNLNRYKLAQQAAAIIVKAVCGEPVKRFQSMEDTINYLRTYKNGLFIVGLDYHVGFIVVDNGEVYFVHSDYINDKVTREKAKFSPAFNASVGFVLGEITDNTNLMNSWLENTKIY
ncbi:hypothetical protein JYT53_00745 [Cytophagaceae bacterium AH-315-L13]|nr:hypothetical protein [Cytophagaceae bacterium AH-315-L13]